MKTVKEALRKNRNALLVFAVTAAVHLAVFRLYDIWEEPLFYAAALSFTALIVLLAADLVGVRRSAAARRRVLSSIETEWRSLPEPESLAESDYGRMIALLGEAVERLTVKAGEERQETLDYYTAWVHQIKTPIAVMKLKLSPDLPEHRALLAELGRVEQYAEMALQFIRLSGSVNDLVIREYPLDGAIKGSIRKFSVQFVEKRLTLRYVPTKETAVTDGKWLSVILDQLISNAVKYTPAGEVSVSVQNGVITVADTGVGIAPEDLPRIFEKGYTGLNGRTGQASSGLGLYLAKKAADLICASLRVESEPGKGSAFTLDLRRKN